MWIDGFIPGNVLHVFRMPCTQISHIRQSGSGHLEIEDNTSAGGSEDISGSYCSTADSQVSEAWQAASSHGGTVWRDLHRKWKYSVFRSVSPTSLTPSSAGIEATPMSSPPGRFTTVSFAAQVLRRCVNHGLRFHGLASSEETPSLFRQSLSPDLVSHVSMYPIALFGVENLTA